MTTVFIYTLEHPVTQEIRYVGKTRNPAARLKEHRREYLNPKSHKVNWVRQLRSEKLRPVLKILDEVVESEWHFWEKYWIEQMRQWGCRLLNHTSGGDGLTSGNKTSFQKDNGAKAVVALHKDGTVYSHFKSGKYAEEQTGLTAISAALKGVNNRAGKYYWFYKDAYEKLSQVDVIKIISTKVKAKANHSSGWFDKDFTPWNKGKSGYTFEKHARDRIVLQYDLNMNFIQEFPSLRSAGWAVGCTSYNISLCCNGVNKTAKKFKWKFK